MQSRINYIFEKRVANPTINGVDFLAEYSRLFHKSERTFWSDWKKCSDIISAMEQTILENNKSTIQEIQENEVKNGLKQKIDWILEIQKELEENRHEESVLDLKTGKVIRYYRTLTPTERKGYIERIAKFSGLDSPNKIAQTDTEGNDIISQKDIQELHSIVDLLNGKK